MADAFTVQNMDLYYGSFHALKNVNLNLASGEITAFIGPSGCGKSTFLKSLNRMNDLVEGCKITGDIRLMGEDIYDKRMDVSLLRRRVGMVFQKPNPFPRPAAAALHRARAGGEAGGHSDGRADERARSDFHLQN